MARAEVILELTGKEAGVLLRILMRIGGDPNGPRGAADSIAAALNRLGISPVGKMEKGPGVVFTKEWDNGR